MIGSISPARVGRVIARLDASLETRPDSFGSVRSFRDGRLVGVVDVRRGRIVHAEHDGMMWVFWPHDSEDQYWAQIDSWSAWVRGFSS